MRIRLIVMLMLVVPLVAGCSVFKPAKYRFTHPETGEPLANLPMRVWKPVIFPILPFRSYNCATDSDGVVSLRWFPDGKNTWIQPEYSELIKLKLPERTVFRPGQDDIVSPIDFEFVNAVEEVHFNVEQLPLDGIDGMIFGR